MGMDRLRIIVGGFIGLLPTGGLTWDYGQYPLGFAALGHDVYYIEDTRVWPLFQPAGSDWGDASANVAFLGAAMEGLGLSHRWAYRDEASGQCYGLSEAQVKELIRTADVLVNVSCATFLRDEYQRIPARVLIDSDPMFTQVQYLTQQQFYTGKPGLNEHTHHFTFGENIGAPDCRIPDCGINWRPTRQPVCLSHWPVIAVPRASEFTTLMTWTAVPPLQYEGESWGQKDVEFQRFFALPQSIPEIPLTVAVTQNGGVGASFPANDAREKGWHVLDPEVYAPDWQTYRTFIQQSRGEFSIAKETYVKARTGWFSCRSACYLAAGRPVVTQDTGWSRYLPTGCGLFSFTDAAGATAALREVVGDYQRHAVAARAIAEEYFDSRRVLTDLLATL